MSNINQSYDPMRERVVGFEMEYSPSFVEKVKRRGDDYGNVVAVGLSEELTDEVKKTHAHCYDGFLDDGYCVYQDGDMTEICTPETFPNDVGMLQLISEQMVIDGLEAVIDHQNDLDEGSIGFLLPLRVSSDNKTSGFHENYQLHSDDEDQVDRILDFLNIFAATEGVWTGQGNIYRDGVFSIAQKIAMNSHGSDGHVEHKGINETLRYEFRRNNYPTTHWQLKYRAAYTSAVIRATELGMLKDFESAEHASMQHTIALQVSEEPKYPVLTHGKNAVDWHFEVAERVSELAEKHSFPDYELEAAAKVAGVIADMQDGFMYKAAPYIPWVFKKLKIERSIPGYFEKTDIEAEEIHRARQICVALDSKGSGGALELLRKADCRYTQKEINQAIKYKTHRLPIAVERGKTIQEVWDCRTANKFFADWMSSKVTHIFS